MSAPRRSFLCASFALVFVGCGPTEVAPTAPAAAAKPERTAQSPQVPVREAVVPRVTLGSKRETAPVKAHYPVPVEVLGCLDLVAAGEPTKAAPVCARARRISPGNTEVLAVSAKLGIE